MATPTWRQPASSPSARRTPNAHKHTPHTNTHSLSSLPDGSRTEPPQAQSPPAHTDPIAPSVPRSMVGKHLAEGGPKRNRRAVIWISRRFWSGFFFESGKSGERCITGDSQAQTSIGAGWSTGAVCHRPGRPKSAPRTGYSAGGGSSQRLVMCGGHDGSLWFTHPMHNRNGLKRFPIKISTQ